MVTSPMRLFRKSPALLVTTCSSYYELSADKQEPYPTKHEPPEHQTAQGSGNLLVQLPAYSITVIRGRIPTFTASASNSGGLRLLPAARSVILQNGVNTGMLTCEG